MEDNEEEGKGAQVTARAADEAPALLKQQYAIQTGKKYLLDLMAKAENEITCQYIKSVSRIFSCK